MLMGGVLIFTMGFTVNGIIAMIEDEECSYKGIKLAYLVLVWVLLFNQFRQIF